MSTPNATGKETSRRAPAVVARVAMGVALAFVVVGCSRSVPEPVLPPLEVSGISAQALWDRITVESNYREYGYWPGHEGERLGQSPHGPVHRIYVNLTLLDALPVADRIAPVGSIIVKDNLNSSRELNSITVMAKVEGFDPDHNDWYWASYGPDGTPRGAGALDGCIACHDGVSANDYVIVRMLDAPLPPTE